MQNKNNRWLDIQIFIVTLALTASVTLWNKFAADDRSSTSELAATARPEAAVSLVPSQPPTRIYLGGPAPQLPAVRSPAPQAVTRSSRP